MTWLLRLTWLFGCVLVALAIQALERRAARRKPRWFSLVRPVGWERWDVPVSELMAAARTTGISPTRSALGFSMYCHGLGQHFHVVRIDDGVVPTTHDGWAIWSNDLRTTAAVLRAFASRFGPLVITIPLELDLIATELIGLDDPRMLLVVDGRLSTGALERKLEGEHGALVVQISEALDRMTATVMDSASVN